MNKRLPEGSNIKKANKMTSSDIDLFLEILNVDSSSSRERGLSDFLAERFRTGKNRIEHFPVITEDCPLGDGTENLLFTWGEPKVFFCTHMDTVPPYIPPTVEFRENPGSNGCDSQGIVINGRGSCDAKGQIMAMYDACLTLEREGKEGFALLLLSGEESGSFGAKSFRKMYPGGEYLIVGEPTDNKMVSACKGTKSFELTFNGKSCHSGYPQHGVSAVDLFVDFMDILRKQGFEDDPVLGPTTWNVGKLSSSNPQNILSDNLRCRIYFRTTFTTDREVTKLMESLDPKTVNVKAFGGDSPMNYTTLEGFETCTAAFGSDAPQLGNFRHRILCGPGSILDAHTPGEFVRMADLCKASEQYVRMFDIIMGSDKEKVAL